jgi:hypothetical protein
MRPFLFALALTVLFAASGRAAFTLTVESAPAGYTGPVTATTTPEFPDAIVFQAGSTAADDGRFTAASSREQFPTYAAIGTTFQFKAALTSPSGGVGYVPAGRYVVRIRNDEFTLPPGTEGTIGIMHTSIVPFAAIPGSPLVTTTATSSILGGNSATVNGSPMLTQMFEALTPKPDGVYTLDQLVTIDLPAGGSGQFSVTSYITAIPAPPALLLCGIGVPAFGFAIRAFRRK